jgi:hypothetical protein
LALLRKLFLVVLFALLQQHCFAKFGYRMKVVTVYYGSTYRFDHTYRHSISADYWYFSIGCISSRYYGVGITYEIADKSNQYFSVRYFRSPLKHPAFLGFFPYIGIAPSASVSNNNRSMNVAPEIGVHFSSQSYAFGFSVNLFYGYDIALINNREYDFNAHRITLKIGLDIDTDCITRIGREPLEGKW